MVSDNLVSGWSRLSWEVFPDAANAQFNDQLLSHDVLKRDLSSVPSGAAAEWTVRSSRQKE